MDYEKGAPLSRLPFGVVLAAHLAGRAVATRGAARPQESAMTIPTQMSVHGYIATTPELQRKLLVDNPTRLYWPEEA